MKIDNRCLAPGVKNIICVSGGKDSLATWLVALDAGVDHIAAFADTGHEHQITTAYLDYLERELGPILRVKADFTDRIAGKRKFIAEAWPVSLVEECGFTPSRADEIIRHALDILHPTGIPFLDLCMWKGRFPSTMRRFCSLELKHEPMRLQVIEPLTSAGTEVVSWQGIRAEESPARAKLFPWETGFDIGPRLSIYRPILNWKHADVFALARRHGIDPNPLYKMGCSRVGCMPCIHARKSELAEIYTRWPEEIARVAEWERLVSACSRRQNSMFFTSTMDPVRAENRIECVTVESHGIETYRDWAMTTRGGRQFDLLGDVENQTVCNSVYAGVCE
jgi:3'-phosphoadenosine 5'-phosphosulfate sulfotransferase (PAPS reductase)/FAD synthetase